MALKQHNSPPGPLSPEGKVDPPPDLPHPRAMDMLLRTPRGVFPALAEGPEDGPVALLCHGFPDIPRTFAPAMARMASAGVRAVAPYLRGYAPAPLDGPFDIDTIADDIAAMAAALGPAPVLLVGHDWGAVATYPAIARHPSLFRAAITLSVPHPLAFLRNLSPAQARRSWYMAFFQPPGLAERAVPRDNFALIDRLWRDWSPGLTPPAGHLDEVKLCLARSMPCPVAYYRAAFRPLGEFRRRHRALAALRIDVPTLHLTGSDDGCIGPEVGRDQQRHFGGMFQAEIIHGAGHFLPLECPDLLADRVVSWGNR